MCSCSGNCNCNSTTIPKGPQGNPGINGTNGISATVTAGNATVLPVGSNPTVTNVGTTPNAAVFNFGIPTGATGSQGPPGPQGINAFTTLTDDFVQPIVGDDVTINVLNSQWMALNQIIYIGPDPNGLLTSAAGFYRVSAILNSLQATVINLGWDIPGITLVPPSTIAGAVGTVVTPSGTIGASVNNAYVLDAKWGTFSGAGGSNDLKTSILVPGGTLNVDYDVLECQTVFKIDASTSGTTRTILIKVCDINGTTGTTAMQFAIPSPINTEDIQTVHINYKIQRIPAQGSGGTRFRSKGECFASAYDTSAALYTQSIINSYLCTSTSSLQLNNSSNWSNNQYITVIANDSTPAVISVIHHEVKVVKKY